MKKIILLLILLMCCSTLYFKRSAHTPPQYYIDVTKPDSKYGTYLAGRVAHVRRDFKSAGDYYAKTVAIDNSNKDLLSQLYIIYASVGDLQKASIYAKQLQKMGDDNNFLSTIIAVGLIQEGKYSEVEKILSSSDSPIYQNFINPLIKAWAYAGQGNIQRSAQEISVLKNEPNLKALYNFQLAMIYDYFNDPLAEKYFIQMIAGDKNQLSFRALQIIANYYQRNNQKEDAIELISAYKNDKAFATMIAHLLNSIETQTTPPARIINTPSKGLAESLFSIAATLRSEGQNMDLAHIFASMALYSNPEYDLAKLLLADILETRGMYVEATDIYKTINNNSSSYDVALRKIAGNYLMLNDYKNAQLTLMRVINELTTEDVKVYLSLGDALRMQEDYAQAIIYYNKALEELNATSEENWAVYYSLGVAYERSGQWVEAEKALLKALELSDNHFLVQNYLGYSWLEKGIKIDNAFALIVDAYKQVPNDGNVADSLGYAFYKLGFYDKAIMYLEEAVLQEPNNPVIQEHLGDAYYLGGRQTEAGFQWSQSLNIKDNKEKEYNPEVVKNKIENGLVFTPLTIEDKKFVEDKIKELEEE